MNRKRLLTIIGIVVVVVVLIVVFDTLLANHQPAITSLEAPKRVVPSGSCQIVCTASDGDGDELSYNWSSSGGVINGEGGTVNWSAPESVGFYNVTVEVTDGRGGEVMSYVIITVRDNRPPTIISLVANADWTLPSGTLQLTCNASDQDEDELSYEWLPIEGSISGAGSVVNWTAPQEVGMYNVTVVVTDGHGHSTMSTLSHISVATGQPPIIEDLLITKDRYGHCYLKPYSGGYKVGKGQKYDIACNVSDMSSELSYNWSCDDGDISEISEDGSMITWIAPNTSMEVTVTVIVSDIAGNMASKNIILTVVSCSKCTFGC